MANIGQCSLMGQWVVSSGKTRTDPGWGGGGGSTSQISNNHDSTDPGGGDIVAWSNSRRPGWSPCVQAYPPLGSQRTIQSSESIEGMVGGRG